MHSVIVTYSINISGFVSLLPYNIVNVIFLKLNVFYNT